jgi:hypothetical protein
MDRAVEGEYLSQPQVSEGIAPIPITITYGYSRDHRPDLKPTLRTFNWHIENYVPQDSK